MMVRLLKEDQAGKSEEELYECFRVFDKYVKYFLRSPAFSPMFFFAYMDMVFSRGTFAVEESVFT